VSNVSFNLPPVLIDTFQTGSTLLIFILAMLLNPDAQARAQAEIDLIVGTERLPTFEDRPSLPYTKLSYARQFDGTLCPR
jgi:hypothetical protein